MMRIITIIFCLISFATFASKAVPDKTESVLKGKVVSSKCHGPVQIWISKGKTLIYQAEAPINGTFEFHLFAGKYDVAATSSDKCVVKKKVELAGGKAKNIELVL